MSFNVAITGGSGFIGSHVVDAMLAAGHSVNVLDPRAPHRPDAGWIPTDIMDVAALTRAVHGADFVYHLAAMADVNDVFADPAGAVALNVAGTANVLEAARRADAGRVVLASTVWVYSASLPQEVDEDTCFSPVTDRHLYATTKIAAEMMCRDYQTLYHRPYTVLRYGIPYGPRMRDALVICAFIRRALNGDPLILSGGGTQHRLFVYVEDLARAHVLAMSPKAENRTYNLEGSRPVTIREIAEGVRDLIGDSVTVEIGPGRAGDLTPKIVSARRAYDDLGWRPEIPFEEGLRHSLAWYREKIAAEELVTAGDD
ncbi:MAG: NAD-dependent epimerase/dehydratase family protein [Chloroflexi bacterium]|nr:NAD-dependent epimerase/dehydratase family protein [Chloroflexota bacterium]